MPQCELLQERRRRTIEKWTAESLSTTDDVDKSALVQRFEDCTGTNTTNFLDLRASDRLAVGDDRQRLERGSRQPLWPGGKLSALDGLSVLRARQYLPAAGDFDELDTVTIVVVMRA